MVNKSWKYNINKIQNRQLSFFGTQKIKFSKESDGTKKYVDYLGIIIEEIFKSLTYEKSKAQLIFATQFVPKKGWKRSINTSNESKLTD